MLHVSRRGQGARTSLLVHGFLGNGRNLASLARRLSDVDPHNVVLVDLRGHGASPPLREGDGLAELAADLCELAASEGRGAPVRLVGHSLGGRVALAALAQAPASFDEVVLLDIAPGVLPVLRGPMQRTFERLMGAPSRQPNRGAMRQFFVEGGVDPGLADWICTNLEPAADGSVAWRIDRPALARMHYRETELDLWAAAEANGSKIHLIYGEASHFVQPDDVARLRAAGARVDGLAGAGHFLHVDALEPLLALLRGP